MPDGLNKVMLIGNLGAEPEMRYTANGSAVTTFRIAVNRSFVGDGERREETQWFRVVAWNKLAELVQAHLGKGQRVYVEGRLSTRSWDGPDGQKRFMTEVIANQVLFLDRPQASALPDVGAGGGDIDPDDIPFEN
jgi:single-strand DNA-binding protein